MMICSSSPGDPLPTLPTSSSAASNLYPDTPGTIERHPSTKHALLPTLHDDECLEDEHEGEGRMKLSPMRGTAAAFDNNRTTSDYASFLPSYIQQACDQPPIEASTASDEVPNSGSPPSTRLARSPVPGTKSPLSSSPAVVKGPAPLPTLQMNHVASFPSLVVGSTVPRRRSDVGLALPNRPSSRAGSGALVPTLTVADDVFSAEGSGRKRERSLASQWDGKPSGARRKSDVGLPTVHSAAASEAASSGFTFRLPTEQTEEDGTASAAMSRSSSSSSVGGDKTGSSSTKSKRTPPQGMKEAIGATIRSLTPALAEVTSVAPFLPSDGAVHMVDSTPVQGVSAERSVLQTSLSWHEGLNHLAGNGQLGGHREPFQRAQSFHGVETTELSALAPMDIDSQFSLDLSVMQQVGGGVPAQVAGHPHFLSLASSDTTQPQQPQQPDQGGIYRSLLIGQSQHQLIYRQSVVAQSNLFINQQFQLPSDSFLANGSSVEFGLSDGGFVQDPRTEPLAQQGYAQHQSMSASSSSSSLHLGQQHQQQQQLQSQAGYDGSRSATPAHDQQGLVHPHGPSEMDFSVAQVLADGLHQEQLLERGPFASQADPNNRFLTNPPSSDQYGTHIRSGLQLPKLTSGFLQRLQQPDEPNRRDSHPMAPYEHSPPAFNVDPPSPGGGSPHSPTPGGYGQSGWGERRASAPPDAHLEIPAQVGRNHRRFSLPNQAQSEELRLLCPDLSPPPNAKLFPTKFLTSEQRMDDRARRSRQAREVDPELDRTVLFGRGSGRGQVGRFGNFQLKKPSKAFDLKEAEKFDDDAFARAGGSHEGEKEGNAFATSGGAGMPRVECDFPGCRKSFKHDGAARKNHADSHRIGPGGASESKKSAAKGEKRASSGRPIKSKGKKVRTSDDDTDEDMYSEEDDGDDDADWAASSKVGGKKGGAKKQQW